MERGKDFNLISMTAEHSICVRLSYVFGAGIKIIGLTTEISRVKGRFDLILRFQKTVNAAIVKIDLLNLQRT